MLCPVSIIPTNARWKLSNIRNRQCRLKANLKEKYVGRCGPVQGWNCLVLKQCAVITGIRRGVCSSTPTDTHLALFEVYIGPDGAMVQWLQGPGVVTQRGLRYRLWALHQFPEGVELQQEDCNVLTCGEIQHSA